jgi:hypothetical protein
LRNFTLQSLFDEVWNLHVGLSSITYDHTFRERNLLEDALSKEGLGLAHGEWVVLEDQNDKLELPNNSQIHPIFQVSFLKKVVGSNFHIQIIRLELDE